MQRQSFDFQLTELPISLALISQTLPLSLGVLSVEALTLALSTNGPVYYVLSVATGHINFFNSRLYVTATTYLSVRNKGRLTCQSK